MRQKRLESADQQMLFPYQDTGCPCVSERNEDCPVHGWLARYHAYQADQHRAGKPSLNVNAWCKQEKEGGSNGGM